MKEFTTKSIAISKNEFGIIDSLSELIAYDSKKLTLIKKQVDELKSKERQEVSKKINALSEKVDVAIGQIEKMEFSERLITSLPSRLITGPLAPSITGRVL